MRIDQIKDKRRRKKSVYQKLFTGPNAEAVLKDLDEQFNRDTLKTVNGLVDPNASIAAAGSRKVLLYIDDMLREENAITE